MMAAKLLPFRPNLQRLSGRGPMTIAIGTGYDHGVIVCADTKVVASDGATTTDSKVSFSTTSSGAVFAIADAAEDARAAKMLAADITNAACNAKNVYLP